MREIGGYIEFDTCTGSMLHGNGIKLNCGRNALNYLIQVKKIKKLLMPKFMCDCCNEILNRNKVDISYYSIGIDFKPYNIKYESDAWLYLVNFYGQLSNEYIETFKGNIIVDNAQAYFSEPIKGVDTFYTCRKFFGVSDGAILFSDVIPESLLQDESFERMRFLLGRFERTASEFYQEYVNNNNRFANEPVKLMSKLTENILHGIDYERVKVIRTENFKYLHSKLSCMNKLSLTIPAGAFMYPLYIDNGSEVRKVLQAKKIYIPILWPSVFNVCDEGELEYDMAKNILPLPVDQRYTFAEMEYIVEEIIKAMNLVDNEVR